MVRSQSIQKPESPTVEELRRDIDAGATRDKVAFRDPAIAPLGADAEAGGAPPTKAEMRATREGAGALRDGGEPGWRRLGPDQDREMEARPDGGVAISWRNLVLGGFAFGLTGAVLVALRFG